MTLILIETRYGLEGGAFLILGGAFSMLGGAV